MTIAYATDKYSPQEIKEHLAEWVAALRSGNYKQGRSRLRRGDEYCCLGVAMELAGVPCEIPADDPGVVYYYAGPYGSALTLTPAGEEWLGVSTSAPYVDMPVGWDRSDDCCRTNVAELNDEGFTFDQIADLVEYFGLTSVVS